MSWRGERPTLPRRRQRQPRDPYRLLVVEAITTNSTTTTRQCHLVTPSAICITQGRSIITGAPRMSQERPQIRPGVSAIFSPLSHVSPCVVSSEWQFWLKYYFWFAIDNRPLYFYGHTWPCHSSGGSSSGNSSGQDSRKTSNESAATANDDWQDPGQLLNAWLGELDSIRKV